MFTNLFVLKNRTVTVSTKHTPLEVAQSTQCSTRLEVVSAPHVSPVVPAVVSKEFANQSVVGQRQILFSSILCGKLKAGHRRQGFESREVVFHRNHAWLADCRWAEGSQLGPGHAGRL